jgi:hypothetical protein
MPSASGKYLEDIPSGTGSPSSACSIQGRGMSKQPPRAASRQPESHRSPASLTTWKTCRTRFRRGSRNLEHRSTQEGGRDGWSDTYTRPSPRTRRAPELRPLDKDALRKSEIGKRVTLEDNVSEHEAADSFVDLRSDMSDVSSAAGFLASRGRRCP